MLSFHVQNAREYYIDARNAGHSDIYTNVNADLKGHNNLNLF